MQIYHLQKLAYKKANGINLSKALEEFKQFVKEKIKISQQVTIKEPLQMENIYYEISKHWDQNKNLKFSKRRLYRKIPMLLPFSFSSKPSLIKNKEFLKAYFKDIQLNNDDRSARKLLKAILRNYDSFNQLEIEQIITVIKPIISNAKSKKCQRLIQIDSDYHIISKEIVSNIAEKMLNSSKSIEDIFSDLCECISPDLWEGKLGEAIAMEILKKNQIEMQNNHFKYLERTLNYFKNKEANQLRLERLSSDLLDYLLRPFIERDPQLDVKNKLSQFIDTYFGDPRVDPRWGNFILKDEIKQVVLRWKTALTLKAFFKLLDHVAQTDPTHDRHWESRRNFWNDFLDRQEILESWLILGKTHIKVLNKWSNKKEKLEYATFLNSTGIQNTHSAIIMKIRNFILVEWSHSGALRIYKDTDKRKPKLYKKEYYPNEIKKIKQHTDGWIQHDQYERWKEEVEDMLFDRRRKRKILNTNY